MKTLKENKYFLHSASPGVQPLVTSNINESKPKLCEITHQVRDYGTKMNIYLKENTPVPLAFFHRQ